MSFRTWPTNLGITATNGGRVFNLNSDELRLLSYDGLSVNDITRLTQRAYGQRGHSDLGFSQSGRKFALTWLIKRPGLKEYYEARDFLIAALRPYEELDPVKIDFFLPTGQQRRIDCYLDGSLLLPSSGRNYSNHSGIVINLLAGDPRLYDPNQISVTNTPYPAPDHWAIPWEIPWEIGRGSSDAVVSINYATDTMQGRTAAPEYPTIEVTGPADNITLLQLTTGGSIKLTNAGGIVLPAGETLTIDLANGIYSDQTPTYRDSAGVAYDRHVSPDSDLSRFYLAPTGEKLLSGSYCTGTNQLYFYATNTTPATQVVYRYYKRYVGL